MYGNRQELLRRYGEVRQQLAQAKQSGNTAEAKRLSEEMQRIRKELYR